MKRRGEENPRVAAEWLLCSATGFKRIELYMNHDQPLGADELATVRNGLLRRKEGEPLQYITGETGFRMLTIACEPGVLIPRPETELLVDAVLTYIDQEVLGGDAARKGVRTKTELPWNDEVERTREAELARAAARADADEAVEERKAVGGGEAGFAAEVAADSENGPAADAAGMAVSLSDGRPGAAAQSGAALDGDDSTGAGFELADVSAASAPDAAAAHDEVGGGASGASADRAVAAGSVDGAGIEVAPDGDSAPRSEARVLEVGCGTGCISLSLASERKGAVRCVAIDIEPRAVALTERNREKAGLTAREVDVRLGDLIGPVLPDELGTFDVLVSNPPYIPTDVMATLPREVARTSPRSLSTAASTAWTCSAACSSRRRASCDPAAF